MIRSLAFLVMAVATACDAPEVGDDHAAPPPPGGDRQTPIPIGCDVSPATGRIRERHSDDPDYWIEALVFGASESAAQNDGDE
jgi:hypothetical protein